jgi:hypothetical protein
MEITGTIYRRDFEDKQTLGEFKLQKECCVLFECKSLELPWLNNQKQKSCIPAGEYQVVPRYSKKFKNHYHVLEVPGRSYILFHKGNYYTDILGCILLGKSHTDINNDGLRDVVSSKKTLNKILKLAPEGFKLCIV